MELVSIPSHTSVTDLHTSDNLQASNLSSKNYCAVCLWHTISTYSSDLLQDQYQSGLLEAEVAHVFMHTVKTHPSGSKAPRTLAPYQGKW